MGKKRSRKLPKIGKRKDYVEIVKENKWYEEYYKTQTCIPPEEFSNFMESMKQPLPAVFRLTGYKKHAKQLLKNLKGNIFDELMQVKLEKSVINMPYSLKWYPDELAWQTNLNRTQIRSIPALEKFHNFLISEAESGHITRQEAVSMIPPLLLDVQPQHKVLDLCAAPGSKTAQLIEMLHSDEIQSNNPIPSGLCIANDKDNKRCYMLVHQMNRLNSPLSMIVNHDATTFPELVVTNNEGERELLKYDRVLADVPCSGDGTMRKNFDVWTKWSVNNAIHLHNIQIRVIQRGLELLATGGRLVYSTCSLNPIEDEAVVAAMLNKTEGAVELIDIRDEMPHLKWTEGVSTWTVQARDKTWYKTIDGLPDDIRYLRPTMFPPKNTDNMNLNRCLRILPHQQDTGGFFVAVVRKTKSLPWQNEKLTLSRVPVMESNDNCPPAKKQRIWGNTYKESPFVFLKDTKDKDLSESIISFYGLSNFPTGQLLSRSESEKKRHLYFTSALVKNIVEGNAHLLKLINTGVRIFSRCDNHKAIIDCDYRIVQDGTECIEPFMTQRVVLLHSLDDVAVLLSSDQPVFEDLSQELRSSLDSVAVGSMVYKYTPKDSSSEVTCDLIMSAWRGGRSTRLYMCKFERAHFLNMIARPVPDDLKPNQNTRRQRNGGVDGNNDSASVVDNDKGDVKPTTEKVEEVDTSIEANRNEDTSNSINLVKEEPQT